MRRKMKIFNYVMMVMIATSLMSCNQSSKKQVESEEHNSEVAVENTDSDYTACYHASKIYWEGSKPTGEHNGIIKLKEGGKFDIEDGKLVGGSFIIDMNSIVNIDLEDEGMNAKLVGHLKSPDFFNVDSFPTASFVIEELKEIEEEEYNYIVTGNLKIKDIENPVEFKANVNIKEGKVSAMSEEFVLNRTLWGVNYQSKSVFKELKDKFIDDEFSIKIEVYSM